MKRHPLHVAWDLFEAAQKAKAHPRLIARLEERVQQITRETAAQLRKYNYHLPVFGEGKLEDRIKFYGLPKKTKNKKSR